MGEDEIKRFAGARFAASFGANADLDYPRWHARTHTAAAGTDTRAAVLGYRPATDRPLFLEAYLDHPIEVLVSAAMGRTVSRADIVEIGCLASTSPVALIQLWHETATALDSRHHVVAATLTARVRRLLARAGVPIVEIARAVPDRLPDAARWGKYYDDDPRVCVGSIADGAASLERYVAQRSVAA